MSTAGVWIISAYLAVIGGLVFAGLRTGWKAWAQRALAAAIVPAGVALVFYVGMALTSSPPEAVANTSDARAAPIRMQLRELSDALVTADKKGDAALAQSVGLAVAPVLARLNDQPSAAQRGTALYHCRLAAVHLSDAAASVAAGGRWLSGDRFQAAAADCRD